MQKGMGFDTETVKNDANVHSFYSFQVYSEDFLVKEQPLNIFTTEPKDIFKLFIPKYDKVFFVAYNLQFDGLVVAKLLKDTEYKVDICLAGSRITRLTVSLGKFRWIFVDLRNVLTTGNLEMVGELLHVNKLEKPCYLGFRAPKTEMEKIEFEQYAMRDAEICFKAFKKIREEFKIYKTTSAGLAMRVFKRDFCSIKKFPTYSNELVDKFRLAYHGGRTECFIRGINQEDIRAYDVNSMYAYVMLHSNFPNICQPFIYKGDVNLEHEGITRATIQVDSNFPLTCIKQKFNDGIDKLCFPNGKYTAYFTNAELRELEQYNEGKILNVLESYEWQNTFNPFTEYIKHYYALKQKESMKPNGANSLQRYLYKMMLCQLYGKFGEKGHCRFLTMNGENIIEEKEAKEKFAWYHSVPIAAYITALARIHLWHILRSLKPEKLYYCDTDSVYTEQQLNVYLGFPMGKELGELKVEEEAKSQDACFIRSKFYLLNDEVTMKGFYVKDTASEIKLSIFNNDLGRYQHRISKLLESRRIKKETLTDYDVYKKFSIEEDGKRKYAKHLNNKELLVDNSLSIPIEVKL
jgi:hypothetical protein